MGFLCTWKNVLYDFDIRILKPTGMYRRAYQPISHDINIKFKKYLTVCRTEFESSRHKTVLFVCSQFQNKANTSNHVGHYQIRVVKYAHHSSIEPMDIEKCFFAV